MEARRETLTDRSGQDSSASVVATTRARAVCVSAMRQGGWRWLGPAFGGRDWEFFDATPRGRLERSVRHPDLATTRACWEAVRAAGRRGTALLVSHEPRVTARCVGFARCSGLRVPHLAWSFNYPRLPGGAKRRLLARAFGRVDRFVVASTMERGRYADAFGIAPERIAVVLWGVALPFVAHPTIPAEAGDYLCAIGGNARDYPTLMAAMARLPDITLVAVVRRENLDKLVVPPNVRIRTDIPLGLANNVLRHSRAMVLPLAGADVPSGHVTLVNAMHLGRALVVTASSGIADYVRDGETALTFSAGDAEDLAGKLRLLWEDPVRCEVLGAAGRAFAARACSEEAVRRQAAALLGEYGLV